MQQGDDTAFFIIYEKYKNAALRTAYLITGNRYTGEDILQETFVQCCLHIKELKDPATFKAWFYKILTRTAWKFAKKEKNAVPVENIFETIESIEEDSEKVYLQKEEREKLMNAINSLDIKQRITIILYYYNEMSVSEIAKVTVLDENGSQTIPVEDGLHLKENYVGNHFSEYDGLLVISYFQGHAAAGFDGAVKNVSVGISSAEGKCLIYSAGSSSTDPRGADQDTFLESMVEAGKSVTDAMNGNVIYMNIMNQRSIDGGFDDTASEQDGKKIGILASTDPVALDQACVDFVYMEDGNETFVNWMEKLNGEYALEYAEKIGLGSSAYTLVSID